MSKWLNTKVEGIEDELLRELMDELESACGVVASPETIVRHFLLLCVYPRGTGSRRVPIATDHLPMSPVLDTKVGKLPDGAVFELCRELTPDGALELFHGERLKNFFNRCIPKFPEHQPLSETAQRKDALVQVRRRNR